MTSEGRDKKEERLEFASDVIPFKEFNRKLKELMADMWPLDKFKTPLIEINGQVFTPKSGPITIKNEGVIVNVTLTTTTKSMDKIVKKARDAEIHQAKLAKVQFFCAIFCIHFCFF